MGALNVMNPLDAHRLISLAEAEGIQFHVGHWSNSIRRTLLDGSVIHDGATHHLGNHS